MKATRLRLNLGLVLSVKYHALLISLSDVNNELCVAMSH